MQLIERAAQLWLVLAMSANNTQTVSRQLVEIIIDLDKDEMVKVLGLVDEYCKVHKLPTLSILLTDSARLPAEELKAREASAAILAVHNFDWSKHKAPLLDDFYRLASAQHSDGGLVSNTLDAFMKLGSQAKQTSQEAYAEIVDKYWPAIEHVCRQQIGTAVLGACREDKNISVLARAIYPLLPFYVHFLLKEDYFVEVCLANRDRLLKLVDDIPDRKSADSK